MGKVKELSRREGREAGKRGSTGPVMTLEFAPPGEYQRGTILDLLTESYAELVSSDPGTWGPGARRWEEFDSEVFNHPETVGSSLFLSRHEGRLVGFASYDPRRKPRCGIIGHNCILPPYRGNGFGTGQIREIIRIFRELGIDRSQVVTLDHPFFDSARRMYVGCGFRETESIPWDHDSRFRMVTYEKKLRYDNAAPHGIIRGPLFPPS